MERARRAVDPWPGVSRDDERPVGPLPWEGRNRAEKLEEGIISIESQRNSRSTMTYSVGAATNDVASKATATAANVKEHRTTFVSMR
jgi:hypothetical protein